MVERFNRTMGAMIRSLIGEEHNWDKILPLTLMAYRSSVHETTQQTPHIMLFGREMTVPLALTMSELPTSLVEQDELQHTSDLREKLTTDGPEKSPVRRCDVRNCRTIGEQWHTGETWET